MRIETIGRASKPSGPTIYALCEWPSMTPRYVGKTVGWVGERHKAHIRDAERGGGRPVQRWLRKQIASGKRLAVKHLEWLKPTDDVAERERYWIAKFRSEYGNMLNLTDGGEGLPGHAFTPEHRAKIAAAVRTGQTFNCEQCGSAFWRKQFAIARGNNRFCSRNCYALSQVGVTKAVSEVCKAAGIAAAAVARRARTHCKRNHPLSGENLFLTSAGSRGCKECRKLHKAKYRSKAHG